MDFITWITRFEVAVRRLQTSWVDLTPLPPETLITVFIRDFFTTQQQEHLTQLIHNGASDDEQLTFVRNIREQIVTDRRERQKANFPLGDNLVSLIFLVQADLNESQRERFISAMNLRDVSMMDYTYLSVKQLFMELFSSTGTSVADPMMRRTQRRNFLVLDEGSLDGEDVLWVQDEETGEEGFMTLYAEDEFWVLQSNRSGGFTYRRTRVPGRQFRKPSKGFRKGKGGSGKGKGKSRPGFQSRRGRSNMTQDANSMYGKGKKGKKGGKSKGKGKGQKSKGKKGDDMPSANEATASEAVQSAQSQTPSEPTWSSDAWYSWENDWYDHTDYTEDAWWTETTPDYSYTYMAVGLPMPLPSGLNDPLGSVFLTPLEPSTSLLTERVDLRNNPSFVILDSGCTKAMGSRYAVNRLIRACKDSPEYRSIDFSFEPCHSTFSFANSETSVVRERLHIHIRSELSPTGWIETTVDVLDQGRVPILFSIEQMRNLRFTLEHTPMGDFISCSGFGMKRTPLPVSTSNHAVLDILDLVKTSRQPKHSFFVIDALVSCPACNGKHRPHTFDENCLKKKPPGKEKPLDKAGEIKMTPAPKRMTKKTAPADDPIAPKDTAKVLPEPSEPASGSKGPDRPSGIPEVIEVPPGLPKPADKKDPTVKTSLPLVLQRIHAKLESDVELYKLHLKHYHMSAEQFKRRTSALRIPAHIYDRYESMVKQCDTCQKSKVAPSRSRISGMRSEVFGELTFIDHGEAPVSPTSKLVFLLIYDGATTLTTAYPVESKGDKETVSCLLDYFETYQLMPKYIVADMAFMGQEMESFYNRKNIHPIALGPSTPWPNRAEAGVRLFKQQVDLMLKTIGDTPSLKDVTYRQLLRQACLARNSMVTFGGVSPIEMAFGPDVQSPGELTAGIPAPEAATHALRHLAMKSYLEARQSADLRQDIASRLRLSDGPFVPGDKVYYWTEDKSKIKSDGSHGGKWIKGKILTAEGSMANIDLGTRVIKVNISKLRKDHNPLEDVQVPLDPLAMYLNTDADRVDPAKVLMARDAAQLSPEGISYSNSHWMPVTSGPIDFLELFSGSARLSQVAALSGLRVGTPVDFRTGFDLNRSLDRQRVMSIIEKQKPMFIFMAVECTAWSIMQNASDPEYRRKKQQKAMPMVEFCSAVAKYQIDHGRFFLIENPSTSSIWYTRSFTRLLNYHQAVTWDNLHMCERHDPEATSSGPPPLPITDDGPSASMPAPKPADKPEFQPSQPAATADEESDADDGEDDTVPYSTGSDRTVPYESDQSLISDLYVDELSWTFLTQEQKLCSNTASFSVPRYITGLPVDVLHTDCPGDLSWLTSHQAFKANVRRQKKRAYGDLSAEYSGITEEDRAFLTLWQTSDDKHAHLVGKKRKEASQQEQRELVKQFLDAKKAECQSWLDNDVYDLVDMRKLQVKNFVSGRWVLTVKRDKDGNFLKCKARWVLRGFEDRQKNTQQTDSPAASRSGFRCVSQLAANKRWDLYHMDLKTAFLQGEAYDTTRDVICQIPKEAGHPPYIGARLKRPAYGLNDAPRRWWNVVDKALLSYGLVPTRADRCTYVLYSEGKKNATATSSKGIEGSRPLTTIDEAVDFLMDPIARNNAQGRDVHGFVCLHVDDLYMGGDDHFVKQVPGNIRKDFNVGSEDKNDIMFVGQRIRWKECPKNGPYLSVDQKLAVDAVEEIKFDKHLKDDIPCTPQLHTAYRSVLGQLNWLQSRTQAHICYRFSRCASAAAKPTIGDVREINKVVRILKSNYIDSRHWPLRGNNRILGFPDASYRNNADKSSQRAHVIFIAEERHLPDPKGKTKPDGNSRGSIVDYESHKITTTTQSTTVAELAALMKCFGTCLFLRGLWADVAGEILPIHIRTDANNLVTTAQTTHLPEQKETHHLIQMLRHESNTGQLHDLSHVSSEYCLADPLTKHSAKPDQLVFSIETGQIVNADMHPPFRTLIKHKAFAAGVSRISESLRRLRLFFQRPFQKRSFFASMVFSFFASKTILKLKKNCVCGLAQPRLHNHLPPRPQCY